MLPRSVTKTDKACDKRSARLIRYINHTKYFYSVGDNIRHCKLCLFRDASFCWRLARLRRVVSGSQAFVPISSMCRKQTALSYSSDVLGCWFETGRKTSIAILGLRFRNIFRVPIATGSFTHPVASVILGLIPRITCLSMQFSTFQATFQRVHSPRGFTLSRTTKQSFV